MNQQDLKNYIKVCKEQLATSVYREEKEFLKVAIAHAEKELSE